MTEGMFYLSSVRKNSPQQLLIFDQELKYYDG